MAAAPVGIIDADDAADVGRVLSKGRDQTRIGHAADFAVAAVDRHDAADVAVAKDVTAVLIVLLYAAAGKATGQTAHKPAAEHVALAGLAVLQRNILAVADKAADEIALEGAGVGQRPGCVEARLDLLLELGLGQVAAGHAFAALQGHAPAVARNAAEELPQHQAVRIALGIALIVGARADRAVVPQARQALGHAGVRRKQVADDAARKAVAGHKAVVDDVRIVVRCHLGSVHRAEHAAHADAAPEGVLVIRLGCRGSVAGLLGLLVCRCGLCNGLRVLVHKQTRYRHVRRNGQVLHDGIRCFGYGNADETANAARLVCIIGIAFAASVQRLRFALHCGGSVIKRQRRGHQRTRRGVRAAGQGAVFQRAGVDAAECADGAHIAPVLVVLRQRRDEFGRGQLELVCLRQRIGGDGLGLDVDLNVRVAQCDVRNFALVLADKADIVVGQHVLLCLAGFCNGLAAQLQIEDGHTGRLGCKTRCYARKFDFFAQFRDRRPGDRVIEGRHLGRRVLPTRRAVDRDAAARPVQAGAVAGLGGQHVGALAGILPIRGPTQIVQMAEVFQVGFVRRIALGQQGVFLVRRFLFAGCVGVAVVLPRLGAHGNVDVLRVVQQAGDAVQARGGNVSVVLTRAQQRRVRHGIQRQHKAALVVA